MKRSRASFASYDTDHPVFHRRRNLPDGRLALGYWIRKKQREFAESGQAGGFSRTYTWGGRKASRSRAEGDVTVQQTQASPRKKINKNVGDYVDYEEIKE